MADSHDGLRWFLVLPVAVAATAATQVAVSSTAHSLTLMALGPESGEAWWLAKAAATPFMGAAFVGAAWWVAPSQKPSVAMLSLGAIAIWSTFLIATSVGGAGFPWPAVLGALGFVGGLLLTVILGRKPVQFSP